jgi:hypothetical protein
MVVNDLDIHLHRTKLLNNQNTTSSKNASSSTLAASLFASTQSIVLTSSNHATVSSHLPIPAVKGSSSSSSSSSSSTSSLPSNQNVFDLSGDVHIRWLGINDMMCELSEDHKNNNNNDKNNSAATSIKPCKFEPVPKPAFPLIILPQENISKVVYFELVSNSSGEDGVLPSRRLRSLSNFIFKNSRLGGVLDDENMTDELRHHTLEILLQSPLTIHYTLINSLLDEALFSSLEASSQSSVLHEQYTNIVEMIQQGVNINKHNTIIKDSEDSNNSNNNAVGIEGDGDDGKKKKQKDLKELNKGRSGMKVGCMNLNKTIQSTFDTKWFLPMQRNDNPTPVEDLVSISTNGTKQSVHEIMLELTLLDQCGIEVDTEFSVEVKLMNLSETIPITNLKLYCADTTLSSQHEQIISEVDPVIDYDMDEANMNTTTTTTTITSSSNKVAHVKVENCSREIVLRSVDVEKSVGDIDPLKV